MTADIHKHSTGLYSKLCDLDLIQLTASCYQIRDMIRDHFESDPKHDFNKKIAATGKVFEQYNFLMYPLPGVHSLYHEIKKFFYECQTLEFGSAVKKQFFVQCWLNVYNQGDYIDWHEHAVERALEGWHGHRPWHGFFCVNAEPSVTSYVFKHTPGQVDVESKNNLLVLGKTGDDMHRTWPWHDPANPRITIAFDIVPSDTIMRVRGNRPLTEIVADRPYFKNHWIPI